MQIYRIFIFLSLIVCASCQETWQDKTTEVLKAQILSQADSWINAAPETVTANFCERSAGGAHDFYSEGDYWWPDPENPDGPFIQRDGETNPGNFVAHRFSMVRFSRIVGAMASAYLLTKDKKYVEQAVIHAKAWFVNPETMMNTSLLFAQAIKGRVTGRGIGIIDTIHLMEIAQGLSRMSDKIDPADMEAFRNWFARYLEWLMTHQYSEQEKNAKNNHATCWAMQVASFARFTGNEQITEMCRSLYKETLLPNQMADNGSFPLELSRTKPYGYSLFNIDAMVMLCQILSNEQNDLWNYSTDKGLCIKKGIEFIYPFTADKNTWTYSEDVLYWDEWPVAHPYLIFGATAFDNAEWFDLWAQLDHNPLVDEVLRNLPIRNPLIWME